MIHFIIKAAEAEIPTTVYGPIIIGILVFIAPFAIGFSVWIVKTLNAQNLALAVLVSETRPTIKLVNEVIDLKLASAELNNKLNGDIEHRMVYVEERLATWTRLMDEDTMNRSKKNEN